ncbi:2-amino-4-hydroxy-6-hydroxymethyldihydropteridine diphosphokinase [Paeniglutamicibacter cryotolerans]|uniref:2-amino-4-hydroxy-6-hydroxymethyldihydropteridine diphosphokinase n=1 Tax=Paeniglutamicibacter cryotolerans TaxID=670079 RepID=A0A839QHD2_9MICC|nr:2-amino-4-hydroxy-6-hydroxymethyldihydropteridine diphosphokinase [Paeniglutamicibacter cryotolerans]MBB2995013.1 2-amino-4-hydroxy-6-hydroxymethyldihydropteridine diphosphokinase [Paeniglutamicibacter cryotolerans]
MSTPVRSVLALGSNLGEREGILEQAVADLSAHPLVRLVRSSPIVATKSVGGPADSPDYLNMVIEVETGLEPLALLAHCQDIEQRHDRVRVVRWGPRTLDVDVITYGDTTSEDPVLTLPHPRAAGRAFVLQPWAWMDPHATLGGAPVAGLAAVAADLAGLRRYEQDPRP